MMLIEIDRIGALRSARGDNPFAPRCLGISYRDTAASISVAGKLRCFGGVGVPGALLPQLAYLSLMLPNHWPTVHALRFAVIARTARFYLDLHPCSHRQCVAAQRRLLLLQDRRRRRQFTRTHVALAPSVVIGHIVPTVWV